MAIRLVKKINVGVNTYDFDIRWQGVRIRKRIKISPSMKAIAYKEWCNNVVLNSGKNKEKTISLFKALDEYLPWVKENKEEKQYIKEKFAAKILKKYLKKDMPLNSLSKKQSGLFLQWYRYSNPSKRKLTNSTLNKVCSAFSFFFNTWCSQQVYSDNNPFSGLKQNEGEGRNPLFLSEEQEEELIAICTHPHQVVFLSLGKDAGLRHGEILSLKWSQINFNEKIISLKSEQTKTRKARTIPILWNSFLQRLIMGYKTYGDESEYVVSYQGKKLTTFRKSWEMIKQKINWLPKDAHIHDLRHQFVRKSLKSKLEHILFQGF